MEEKKRHSKEPGIIEGQYGNDMILSHHQIIANYAPGNLLTGFRFYNPYWPLDIVDVSIEFTLLVPMRFDISNSNDLTSHELMTRFGFHADLSVVHLQGYWAMDEAVTRVSDFFLNSPARTGVSFPIYKIFGTEISFC
ncbi:hypothetical protein OIU76_030154 [Salix suchowensis]|nr:hypothetical protein OIU76_030154 [Salix suchowensis]